MADGAIIIGIDDSEFDAILERVGIDTQELAQDVEEVENAADEAEKRVREVSQVSEQSLRKTIRSARQVAAMVRGLTVATGNAFNQVYAIGIEVTLLTAEVLLDIATAEATTLVGAIGVGARLAQIFALMIKASQLRQGQMEAASRTEGIIATMTALEALTYF